MFANFRAKLKQLLSHIELSAEALAIINLLKRPLSDWAHLQAELDILRDCIKQQSATIRRYRQGTDLAMRFSFHCGMCDEYVNEPVPPELRFTPNGPVLAVQCCALCVPKCPHLEGHTQRRPIRRNLNFGIA